MSSLQGVVEVQLDLVGGRADRLVTRELELLEEVLVRVLRHLAALVRVEEDVVDVEGRRHQGLLVGSRDGDNAGRGGEGAHRPQALTNRAEIEVDLDLVVLESDQGEGKAQGCGSTRKGGGCRGSSQGARCGERTPG
jgi:hypothetical protein